MIDFLGNSKVKGPGQKASASFNAFGGISFTNLETSDMQWVCKIKGLQKEQFYNGKIYEVSNGEVKDITLKMFREFYQFMWMNRSYWEPRLKNA